MRPQGSPRHMGRPQETPALPSRWGPSAESPGEGPRPPGPGQARFGGTCPVCPFPRRPLPPSRPSRRTMRDQTWATTLSSSLTRGENVVPRSRTGPRPVPLRRLRSALGPNSSAFPGFESALLSEPMWLQTVLPPVNAENQTKPGLFPAR